MRLIQKHNLEADRGVHTYTLGINKYADMVGIAWMSLTFLHI